MDCPKLRFKNGFVDHIVQKLQREQPLEVWSTSSSELGMFVTRNVLRGRRRRRKLETISQAIEQSPKASTHRLRRVHSIPKPIVWQTLRFVLKKRPITSRCWTSPNSTFTVHSFLLKQQSRQHLDMLDQFLQPQLFADNILDFVVFQQDGAPPHYAHIVRNYLNETFPGRWFEPGSPRFWAASVI